MTIIKLPIKSLVIKNKNKIIETVMVDDEREDDDDENDEDDINCGVCFRIDFLTEKFRILIFYSSFLY